MAVAIDTPTRAETRREWALLHTADAMVISLGRSDIGYAVTVESALGRRFRGEGRSIAAALRVARLRLGLTEVDGRLAMAER